MMMMVKKNKVPKICKMRIYPTSVRQMFSFIIHGQITLATYKQWNVETKIFLITYFPTLYFIYNGAKLGDAIVARAPPLLCCPQNFIV